MIYFGFRINSPFSNVFKNIFCKSGQLTTNKFWEVECYQSSTVFEVEFQFNINCDHAGIRLDFGLLGYTIAAQIYDNRHWDDENDKWHTYDNPLGK